MRPGERPVGRHPVSLGHHDVDRDSRVREDRVRRLEEADEVAEAPLELDLQFITETLETFKSFCVSNCNRAWVEERLGEWKQIRTAEGNDVQLAGEEDADSFLQTFYSPYTDRLWDEDYANNLIYTQFSSGIFKNQVLGIGNPDSKSLPIVVDQIWNPHLLYQSFDEGLVYATMRTDIWIWIVVDPSPGAGQFSDITLDDAGTIHLAYYDASEGDLIYAYLVGDVFKQQLIDANGNVGQYPSIVVDSSGYVHISYYDSTNKDLKYAHGKGGQWAVDTVDNNGSVGEYSSIAIDSNDKPYIAYFDRDNEDLKLARAMPLMP